MNQGNKTLSDVKEELDELKLRYESCKDLDRKKRFLNQIRKKERLIRNLEKLKGELLNAILNV